MDYVYDSNGRAEDILTLTSKKQQKQAQLRC